MSAEDDLYVRANGPEETLECALMWQGMPAGVKPPLPLRKFVWTETASAFFERIRRLAKDTGKPEGKTLPYADLRAAMQARIKGVLLLQRRILSPKLGEPVFAADAEPDAILSGANRVVANWCQLTLRPWVEKLGIDCGDVDALEARARAGELFDELAGDPKRGRSVANASGSDFHDYADPILAIILRSLDGVELFAGLGPVHRIIDVEYGNSVSFETWPAAAPGGADLFSMVTNVSVETRPSSGRPFVVIRAMKRIWCREFPKPNRLFGRSRISVRVAQRGTIAGAMTLSMELSKGEPAARLNTALFEAQRSSGEAIGDDVVELVRARGHGRDLFVGVPFRYGYRPTPDVESGVTLQDQVDLTRRVAERIAAYGFVPSPIRVLPAAKRSSEYHQAASLFNLITHHFGHVEEADLPARVEELFGAPERKPRGRDKPIKTVDIEPLVAANRSRLDKAFGKDAPVTLVLVCRREDEERIFRSVVELLFGGRVKVVRYALPDGVHGTKRTLDGATLNRSARAALRREAWKPLAEQIKAENPGTPMIVQVAREYDGFDDDSVNKDVGRNTLATVAGCSVQYLLPAGSGKAAEYMHRVQAALYDLLFAHSGLGPTPSDAVRDAFASPARPRTIVGISLVAQAASRTGRPDGADLAVAFKIDATTGAILGRFGRVSGAAFDTGRFQPMSRTLVDVASAGSTSLGSKLEDRRRNFLRFVRSVTDEVAAQDPNAVLIIESTNARGLWAWLSDEHFGPQIFLEDRSARPPVAWANLRFIRLRERAAGRLAVQKGRHWLPVTRQGEDRKAPIHDEVYATAIDRLVESVPEAGAKARHYLCAHGFSIRNRGARGQSVYRSKDGFQKVGAKTLTRRSSVGKVLFQRAILKPWDKPSRIPGTLEITVLPSPNGDDADATASLVATLRSGYSHTADGTYLPAPLSFKSKIHDYMDRYGTGSETDTDDPVEEYSVEGGEEAEAEGNFKVQPVPYSELRRWFEGSPEFDEEDVPDFDGEEAVRPTRPRAVGADVVSQLSAPRTSTDFDRRDGVVPSAVSVGVSLMETDKSPAAEGIAADAVQNLDDFTKLVQVVTTPSARLPGFVTRDFVASIAHFVNGDVRRMHEDRDWIRAATGYPWPEARPAPDEMAAIYAEGLKYPAFAIMMQHRFFTHEKSRGLPKSQIRREYKELSDRARRKGKLSDDEENLFVLGALRLREAGGDLNLILAELVSLPGNVAWMAKCRKASDGLTRLEGSPEFKETALYLRDIVGPFGMFDDGQTIGEVLEKRIIPERMKVSSEGAEPAAAPRSPDGTRNAVTADQPDQTPWTETGIPESKPGAAGSETVEHLQELWSRDWASIATLAGDAARAAPSDGPISRTRDLLGHLADIRERISTLTPKRRPIRDLQAAIKDAIGTAAGGLVELIGEELEASELLSLAAALPEDSPVEKADEATALQIRAKDALSGAEALANEISKIEEDLPVRQARAKTGDLIDKRERLLRDVLDLCRQALGALAEHPEQVRGSDVAAPGGPDETGAVEVSAAATPAATPVETKPEIQAKSREDGASEDIADIPPPGALEIHDENPVFAPVSPPPAPAQEETERSDPLRDAIIRRLDELFAAGEHGLAFHLLQAAAPTISDLLYTPAELRLAAGAGRVLGLSGQDLQVLTESRGEVLSTVQQLSDEDDDRSLARLTLLLAGSIPTALFRSEDVAAVSIVEGFADHKRFSNYAKLIEVVEENRKRGFPLTSANLLALDAHSRADDFVTDSIAAIKASVDGFRSSRFRFQLGEKVKHALLQSGGLLGRLADEISEADVSAARDAMEELTGRDRISSFVDKTTADIANGQEIDGAARERILNVLSQIGQRCSELVQAVDGFKELQRVGGRLDSIKRLRDLALAGVDEALAETEIAGSRLGAARVQSAVILQSLGRILRGGAPDRDPAPLAVNLHGPLLWIPNLSWTGGWRPSPYDLDRLMDAIMSVTIPLLAGDPAAKVVSAFEARRSESAFVPAHMLLSIGRWHGVPERTIEDLRAKIDADKETKKNQVAMRLSNAERMIDRMRRMAVGSLDQSARLKETLAVIDPKRLPAEIPSNFIPETLEGDRIQDFNSALSRINDVEAEAKREFDKARKDYDLQIGDLQRAGSLDAETERELRNLLDRHEFTTLADWLNMIRTGGVRKPILPSGPVNTRLAGFKAILPQLGSVEPLQVAKAVESGSTVGPLDYQHLDKDRREEGAVILRRFPELKRLAKDKGGNRLQLRTKLAEALSQLLYDVTRCDDDPVLTRYSQQIYVFDVKLSLPASDAASLILPEFGSLTQGAWRACVVTPVASIPSIANLAEGAALRGVVVIYLGVLGADKREQLRTELTKRKRAMLVIDEALVAAAIADREDHRRAIFEIAQGYSSADPYKDHGKSAVPAEMFKGRSEERRAIVDAFGSYVVYGGRRLGKTALLHHIHATQPANALFVYVDMDLVSDPSDAFEQISKRLSIFRQPVRGGEAFASAVIQWLQEDERRRILLLLDEADRFVRHESESGFQRIQTLLQLMAETRHRFKFVLAGLHNVSRSIRAENSPLVQIANNPLKIGPLVDRDVDDAEFLVRGPLAAMGYEFENREDVWRILSFTNYYPVLIQVFCQELLRLIHEQVMRTGSLPPTISSSLVERALRSSDVRRKLFASFERTIGSIEDRYELITYILAAHELIERESGMKAEGMTAGEVADRAMECWPAAFKRGSDPTELEYLLEEMEGFGIARRTVSGAFALRSRSLLELMADSETDLNRKLDAFKGKPEPPKPFDPKNFRRILGKPISRVDSEGRTSPLTDGQEADLLAPSSASEGFCGIGVVFGAEHAGIKYVEAALLESRRAKDKIVEIDLKVFAEKKEMLDEARKATKSDKTRVIVVASQTEWRPDWVVDAERIGRVRKGEVRIVFVGDKRHAEAWAKDTTVLRRVLPQIKLVKLRPWTRSYLGSRIESLHLPGDLVDLIHGATGGWSETAGPLLNKIAAKPNDADALIAGEASALIRSGETLDRLGIPPDLVDFFRELAAYADGSKITPSDFQYLCTSDGRKIAPRTVGLYSDLMGIISFPPDRSAGQAGRKVDLNPLALAALLDRG
ncbi:MAG: RNaseH domain-containing protein [Gemmataceae bacterium]|nr:RNaseH domain-containing protein [Gemmataceae bacterium]